MRLHLTAISLLAPRLTTENHQRVLGSARHKTKREVEEIVASLRPQPPVVSWVRKVPPLLRHRLKTCSWASGDNKTRELKIEDGGVFD